MSGGFFEKVYNFLTTSPLRYITAFSVIYQIMEDEPWIDQETLRGMVNDAVSTTISDAYPRDKDAQNKLLKIAIQVSK